MDRFSSWLKYQIIKLFHLEGITGVLRFCDWGEITIVRADGRIEHKVLKKRWNIITNTGKAEAANLLGNVSTPHAFTYLAVGSDDTAENATQTGLIAEITDGGLARAAATVTRVQTTVSNDTLNLYKDWTGSATRTIKECGVFNDPTTGIMLGRKLTGTTVINNLDHFQLTYKVACS